VIVSTTLNFNAVAPLDATRWRPYDWPMPGLRSVFNRGDWLSPHRTQRGTDWTLADAYVDGNIAQGLEPLALLHDDPSIPFDPVWHGDYWKAVTARYSNPRRDGRPRVSYFEVLNEYDSEGWWGFDGYSGGDLAGRIWRCAVDAIRSVQPGATVVCGSVQSVWPTGHGLQVTANALRAYGPWLPDDLSVHLYPTTLAAVPTMTAMIERFRGACLAHAKGAPRIWVTEWSLDNRLFSGLSSTAQGAFLRDGLRAQLAAGVHSSIHYLFDDPNGYGFRDRAAGKTTWNNALSSVIGSATAVAKAAAAAKAMGAPLW
jgi:hypothetical protein